MFNFQPMPDTIVGICLSISGGPTPYTRVVEFRRADSTSMVSVRYAAIPSDAQQVKLATDSMKNGTLLTLKRLDNSLFLLEERT